MPQREARFHVPAPRDALWHFIRDFEALCRCIPGVEKLEVIDDRTATLTVQEKLGVVPLIVELSARIESETPPQQLRALATAEYLTMRIAVTLQAEGAGTTMTTLFDVRGEGPLKPVVDRLFERRASERTQQFAASLEQRFGAVAAPQGPPRPASEPTPAGKPPPRGWIDDLRRWLARHWRRRLDQSDGA